MVKLQEGFLSQKATVNPQPLSESSVKTHLMIQRHSIKKPLRERFDLLESQDSNLEFSRPERDVLPFDYSPILNFQITFDCYTA